MPQEWQYKMTQYDNFDATSVTFLDFIPSNNTNIFYFEELYNLLLIGRYHQNFLIFYFLLDIQWYATQKKCKKKHIHFSKIKVFLQPLFMNIASSVRKNAT